MVDVAAHSKPVLPAEADDAPAAPFLLWPSLPEELLQRAFLHLDSRSLARAEAACRGWRRAASADFLWRDRCAAWSWLTRRKPSGATWKRQERALSGAPRFVVVGGAYSARGRAFSAATGAWADVPAMATERNGAALLYDVEGASLCAVGGRSSGPYGYPLASVERLACGGGGGGGAWAAAPPMATARCCLGAAFDDAGRLLVAGGAESMYKHAAVHASAEVYAPGADAWAPLPPLGAARCAHSLALSAAGTAYAVGGYGGGLTYLASVECLDVAAPERGWRAVASLNQPRAGACAAFGPDHCLYVIGGGGNGHDADSTCVKWDSRANQWLPLAPMHARRHYFAAAFAPDGQLYAAGGFEWSGQLTTAEVYDARADRWRPLPDLVDGGAVIEFCAGAAVWA